MGVRIGIDVGSKTVKVVIVDGRGEIVRSLYRRHLANVRTTLAQTLRSLIEEAGDVAGPVAFTGSAGIALAQALGAPHVQEVVATTRAVRRFWPEADAFIELGGEDAKVVYLTGGLEQRMNATCAGGTGGFIDTLAGMLGVRSSGMNRLASKAKRLYPIASRCAVFAQTDVRPLLNAGADPQDIAASVLDAVARQTLGGLACGRPLRGTVVFLGGPLEHIPALVDAFRRKLGLDERTGIKPYQAHLQTARGATLEARKGGFSASLSELAARCEGLELDEEGLDRLAPLFSDAGEVRAFSRRHAALRWPRISPARCEGPLFLGIDAGSTTVKLALVDGRGRVLHSEYRSTHGDVFDIASAMLARVWRSIPQGCFLAWSAATGYGEDLLRAGLGIDEGVVETIAHAEAACALVPDASFVLDIGGQDMKALWIREGRVVDAVLNEACSSGCGAFLEGTAYALGSTPGVLATAALTAKAPVDLGTKCTVFMSSRVKHAQKIGASLADLGAGLAYSVVRNALYRIVGADRLGSIGERVVVQGGGFKSDAVLRAFERVAGCEASRPDTAHLMGALGAALTASKRWHARRERGEDVASGVIDAEALQRLMPRRQSLVCGGCANACRLALIEFGEGKSAVSGNRCERGRAWAMALARGGSPSADARPRMARRRPPNVARLEQKLIARAGRRCVGARGSVVGIMDVLSGYEAVPFWTAFFQALGFGTVAAGCTEDRGDETWLESVASESACYPAKQANKRLFQLAGAGVDFAFMPTRPRDGDCPVLCGYAGALAEGSCEGADPGLALIAPRLSASLVCSARPEEGDAAVLQEAFRGVLGEGAPSLAEVSAALECAQKAQERFKRMLGVATDAALRWIEEDPRRRGAVLGCRPYHIDPAALHRIDDALASLGFAVLVPAGLRASGRVDSGGASLRAERADALEGAHDRVSTGWDRADELASHARIAAGHPQFLAVFLRSFGCTMDAAAIEEARSVVEGAGDPFTLLKIDDIVDVAHINIRLRTLASTCFDGSDGARESFDAACAPSSSRRKEGAGMDGRSRVRGAAGRRIASLATVDAMRGPLSQGMRESMRRDLPGDLCTTVAALAARVIDAVRSAPDGSRVAAVRVPYVCRNCVLDALPLLVRRACGYAPRVQWIRGWPGKGAQTAVPASDEAEAETPARAGCGERPSVGIIGNALLCYEAGMNDDVAAQIASLGCRPVVADPRFLDVDDVCYLAQFDMWYADGIRDAVYLNAFGCLKGHVEARGALRALERRYPGMRITVIDYDFEASALNRENRLRLVAESALHPNG